MIDLVSMVALARASHRPPQPVNDAALHAAQRADELLAAGDGG